MSWTLFCCPRKLVLMPSFGCLKLDELNVGHNMNGVASSQGAESVSTLYAPGISEISYDIS